ncbi:DUF1351 domain-containing protein [Levilactobacillus namurensis]|uniref:DUF1351 domain-containing protein n=1 Tax=Levilactobacillus namurensis TaxID=380393 RepID=A0AAW8W5Q3_9LACO|nr:DUF1351 domain-containing protein [Levilactobacillus namurensis]MDT7015346.1 DUF1351 domain-containing protein [Levilactobacillus namurensis]
MTDKPQLTLPDYRVEYLPTIISIQNYEQLQQTVNDYANKFNNMVVTDDTEKDAKNIRAELRKVSAALDDRRKEIKKDFNRPYDDFAEKVNVLRASLDRAIIPIDAGLKELEEQQRQARLVGVQDLIEEMAPNYGVDSSEIEVDPTWLNKTISNKKIVDGIAGVMVSVKKAKDKLASDIKAITKYAEVQQVDPAGWVDQLKQGQDVDYLMQAIDQLVEKKQAQQRQLEAKAAEEQTHQETRGDAIVDTNTGEVVSHQVALMITATIPQMEMLKSFMDANRIGYERVK